MDSIRADRLIFAWNSPRDRCHKKTRLRGLDEVYKNPHPQGWGYRDEAREARAQEYC
ncbi:hypothetical protein [Laspinema palackyanum]|uniref:hypothetical protein n=1 Tax=Laspinema palackyanum TaxID=3231601 RepID=UPI00345DE97F|nr:hypothetical protein [Laspinema sp. D2c]